MSFSAEMKDFINAYSTGQKTNASRTTQDYQDAQRDALEKKTARENDPAQLELEDKKAQLELKLLSSKLGSAGVNDAYKRALTKYYLGQGGGGGSGMTEPGSPGYIAPAGGKGGVTPPVVNTPAPAVAAPPPAITNTSDASDTLGDPNTGVLTGATGGLIPDRPVRAYEDGGAVPVDGTDKLRAAMIANNATRGPLWSGDAQERSRARSADIEDDLEAGRKGKDPAKNRRILPGYAAGGAVPDDDDDDDEEKTGVLPTGVANAQAQMPTDISARRRNPGIEGVIAPGLVNDAVRDGTNYNVQRYGVHRRGAVRGPSDHMLAMAYVQGHGGISPEEMKAAGDAVDPDHQYTDSQRNMLALGSVYQHWNNKGDPEKAARAAGQMLQYFRHTSQNYAAIAKHAADGGKMDLAAQAMMRAYQNVPDGNDMTVQPNPDGGYFIHMTGPDGKDIVQTVVTPQQLGAEATGLASGGFDKSLLHAAGVQEQQDQQGKGPKAPTLADRTGVLKVVDAPNSPFNTDKAADDAARTKAGLPTRDGYWNDVHAASTHGMLQNSEADPSEVHQAAKDLMTVDPDAKDPLTPFKVSKDEDTDEHTLTFKNGIKMKLSPEKFDAVMNQRAAALRADDARVDTESDAEDEPSWYQKRVAPVGGAIGSAAGAAGAVAAGPPTSAPVFPGGATGALPVDQAPVPVMPRSDADRPYVPFLAGRQ